jgi:dienelactone hydrolase
MMIQRDANYSAVRLFAMTAVALFGVCGNTGSAREFGTSAVRPDRAGEVVAHLHRIYQNPPPLQKAWPPSSLAEWEQQRSYYVDVARRTLNLPPDSKRAEWPLNLRFTKPDFETPTFTLKYLVYESQPDLWVTANLYIPKGATLPGPTAIVLQGHTVESKAAGYLQPLILNLVNKGYVVFAKDGIGKGERTATGHYHGKKSAVPFLSGITIDGLETWDNLRAIDLLCSEPMSRWVDPDRIGVAGMSGGAMQTFYLAILDDRIKAAAPVSQRNTYTAEFHLWNHCICCVCATGIRRAAEQYHLLAAAAPRPFLICSGTEDPNHPIEGARELVRQARAVYDLHGRGDHLHFVEDKVAHTLAPKFREAIYAFFNRHLAVDATATEETFPFLTSAQLDCGLPAESTMTVAGLVYRHSQELPRNRGIFSRASEFRQFQENLAQTIRDEVFGYSAYVPQRCALNSSTVQKREAENVVTETIRYNSEPDLTVAATFSYPKRTSRVPAIIGIDVSGEDVRALTGAGYAVLSVKSRPTEGNSSRYGPNWGVWARGISCGKPPLGMQVYDILRSIDYLETRGEIVDAGRIGGLGRGTTVNTMTVLYAAALDHRFASTILEDPLTTYKPATEKTSSWHEWEYPIIIPQILLHADVSQVASLIAPRPLLIVGGRDLANRTLSAAEVQASLHSCRQGYELLDSDARLSVVESADQTDLVSWFDRQLAGRG